MLENRFETLMNRAIFRFHGSLNDFLPRKRRHRPLSRTFNWRASIKDMVESLNVPHPEVALLVVNGVSVDFDYIVMNGDQIDAYAYQHDSPLAEQILLRPPLTGKPRFILDTHLGRLAAYLRMAGFDTLYRNDFPDDELAHIAHHEQRVLLTRDIGLLKRGLVTYGYFVRATNPRRRLIEVTRRYRLAHFTDGADFGRCARCNGTLNTVEKADILEALSERTASHYDLFSQCADCAQVYWKGSHYEQMQALLDEAMATS